MGNVLRIDRMSLRDEKIGKFGFGPEITVKNQSLYPPLYMANKNKFFFYLLKIFYVYTQWCSIFSL